MSADPNAAWLRSEAVLDEFEKAWQERAEPAISEFLRDVRQPERRPLLLEMIRIDLEYRWGRGEQRLIEDYASQFPELGALMDLPIDLLVEECKVREFHGRAPSRSEIEHRFPGRMAEIIAAGFEPQDKSDSSRLSSLGAHAQTHDMTPEGGQTPPDFAPSTAPEISVRRLGRYELREQLGRGGFATVFRAYDSKLQRDVAIKVPRAECVEDPVAAERVIREARSAARLRHAAIVPLFEVAQHESTTYIVYEYVPGPTLAQKLRQELPKPRQAAAWVARIADALDYAHQCGIVHRDVKSSNILLDNDELPMLADFGLARHADSATTVTQHGDILGTPAYMAPEQARGDVQEIGSHSDIYSLGVVLYELLSGRLPFQGTGASVLHRVIHEEPPMPGRLRREVPIGLETICLKAMAKDPRHRYATAGEMADDLRRYLEHRPITARRTSPIGRLALACRRKPALAATILLASVFMIAVAAFSVWRIIQERDLYLAERGRAQANLYRALISDALAQMQARDVGWWWKTMQDIREAARLDVPSRDPVALRELAIQCMGTEFPCFRLLTHWKAHHAPATSVAFSPHAAIMATGSRDQSVRLWSLPDGNLLAVLSGHAAPVTQVKMHPRERELVSSAADGSLRFWRLPHGKVPKDVPLTDVPCVRALESGLPAIRSLEYASDGTVVAAGHADGSISLISQETSDPVRTLRGHTGSVLSLKFFPNGKTLVSGSSDETVRFWDVATCELLEVSQTGVANVIDYSAELNTVAWSQGPAFGAGIRWLDDFKSQRMSQMHGARITHLQWIERWLLTASADGTIKLWETYPTFRQLAIGGGEFGEITAATVHADNNRVAATYFDGTVRIWELYEPEYRTWLNAKCQRVTFAKDKVVTHPFVADLSGSRIALKKWGEEAESEQVRSITTHPSDKLFAFAVAGTLHVHDYNSHESASQWLAHTDVITQLRSSPDGAKIASASRDGTVKTWSWTGGAPLETWQLGDSVEELEWNAHGLWASTFGRRGQIWRLEQGQSEQLPIAVPPRARSVALGPGLFATARSDGTIDLWNAQGELVNTLRGHVQALTAMDFSTAGDLLLTASLDKTIRAWELPGSPGGQTRRSFNLGEHAPPTRIELDPQASYLLLTGERWPYYTELRDFQTGALVGPQLEFGGRADTFTFDGSHVIAGRSTLQRVGLPSKPDGARSEPVNTNAPAPTSWTRGPIVRAGAHADSIWGLASSPDGRWIATAAHDRTAKIWDAETMTLLRTLAGHNDIVWPVAFSPDSKLLATGSENVDRSCGEIKIWDVETGVEVQHLEGHTTQVFGLDFHPSGRWLASSSKDGSIWLWDTATWQSLGELYKFDRPVFSVAFRPDGRWLAAGCIDYRVGVWDLEQIGFPAGQSAGSTGDDVVFTEPHRVLLHAYSVYAVRWDPAGQYLATGSDKGLVTLWDGDKFNRVVSLKADNGQIRDISFSHDGRRLAAAAYARPSVVWDLSKVRRTLAEMQLDW